MSQPPNTNTDCRLIAEYTDEGEVPEAVAGVSARPPSNSQVERPTLVADFHDLGSKDDSEKEFKVLLSDQRVATVRGHSLRFVPNAANPQDYGSYGIVRRAGEQEVLAALFRVAEVKGVFSGDVSSSRESA